MVVPAVADTSASEAQVTRFLKLTGYRNSDLHGTNKTGTFVTTNGGKYQMDKAGKKIDILSGPDYPNLNQSETPDQPEVNPERRAEEEADKR
jgi:hypothetical protein